MENIPLELVESILVWLFLAAGGLLLPIVLTRLKKMRNVVEREAAGIARAAKEPPQTDRSFFCLSRGTILAWCRDDVIQLSRADATMWCLVGSDLLQILREELPDGGTVDRQVLEHQLNRLRHAREMKESQERMLLALVPIDENFEAFRLARKAAAAAAKLAAAKARAQESAIAY